MQFAIILVRVTMRRVMESSSEIIRQYVLLFGSV